MLGNCVCALDLKNPRSRWSFLGRLALAIVVLAVSVSRAAPRMRPRPSPRYSVAASIFMVAGSTTIRSPCGLGSRPITTTCFCC